MREFRRVRKFCGRGELTSEYSVNWVRVRPLVRKQATLFNGISVLASTRGDLGEAKLSCKPDMKAPPNNRFLKCEPQYPHELRGEAKLSSKKTSKKNFEKFLPAHYTN